MSHDYLQALMSLVLVDVMMEGFLPSLTAKKDFIVRLLLSLSICIVGLLAGLVQTTNVSRPIIQVAGADPGFRRGGGGSYIQKGGGGVVQEFQERIQIVAGSWANQQAKQNCRQP